MKIPENIEKIAKDYNVLIQRDVDNYEQNSGGCAGGCIYLANFDDSEIELVAFFHELGHALSNKLVCKRGFTMTKLSSEGLAWELGLGIAFDYGYKWDYYDYVMVWAREQFKTYFKEENIQGLEDI